MVEDRQFSEWIAEIPHLRPPESAILKGPFLTRCALVEEEKVNFL